MLELERKNYLGFIRMLVVAKCVGRWRISWKNILWKRKEVHWTWNMGDQYFRDKQKKKSCLEREEKNQEKYVSLNPREEKNCQKGGSRWQDKMLHIHQAICFKIGHWLFEAGATGSWFSISGSCRKRTGVCTEGKAEGEVENAGVIGGEAWAYSRNWEPEL